MDAETPFLRAIARRWKERAKMYRVKLRWESDRNHGLIEAERAARDSERFTRRLLNVRDDELATLRTSHAALLDAARELSLAAVDVNKRYIGGSALDGRLGEALGKLAQANAVFLRALTSTETPSHG